MTVGSDFRFSLPNMALPHASYDAGLGADDLGSHPRIFKRHKVLPRPRRDDPQRLAPARYGLPGDGAWSQNTGSTGSITVSRQRASRAGRGPEPPPTPPAHSRTSSASHAADPSSPKPSRSASRNTDNVESRPPVTPPIQQTPPTPNLTPDRTPPGPAASQPPRRPPITDRNSSKLTTDSRAESFRTAPENPYSSDEDDGKYTLRPALPSTKTSQSTVRQVSGGTKGESQPVGLGLGLEASPPDTVTPRTAREFSQFDGEWGSGRTGARAGVPTDGAGEEWNNHVMRNVTIRKRRPTRSKDAQTEEVVDDRSVTPTNATRALRSMSLQESPIVYPSRRVVSDRLPTRVAPSNFESSSSTDIKRSSIMSTRSTASTIVEAVLVETAPQRRRTLRHVRKQSALRDSGSEISPVSSAPTSVSPAIDDQRRPLPSSALKPDAGARDSHASTATSSSISSRKARRDVWKNGGVPVVVIPDRRSSIKSKTPSLRSTSSRRSPSLSSVPILQSSQSREIGPQFEKPARRSRAYSESDGSRPGDERTMDFPPVVPTRSSSLSAPTSRNASRTGSLTAESLKAHNMLQAQQAHHALQMASHELDKLHGRTQLAKGEELPAQEPVNEPCVRPEARRRQPAVLVEPAPRDAQSDLLRTPTQTRPGQGSSDTHEEQGGLGVDRDGDPFYGNRLSVQNTPFSVASVETTGTSHAEVSEAQAVNIYPHQSKSVVLVNHSAKPSESSSLEQHKAPAADIPLLKTTGVNGGVPITPPQQFSVDEVDSPLRNPRAPPLPPAINFIPATPSGLTPATEKQKQLGNYYEMTEGKPKRSMSLLRRALTRRATEYGPSPARPVGLLSRTLSLSRNVRRRGDWDDERPRLKRHSTADDMPADETRLHPFWRPAYAEDDDYSSEEEDYDGNGHEYEEEEDPRDRTYRYPPVDNRPAAPRRTRSLSDRIRRTFAILPLRYDGHERDYYPATAHDRRTIRRTPSGNLRVMKFRRSMESLTPRWAQQAENARPFTSPGPRSRQQQPPRSAAQPGRYVRLWRSLSLKARLGRSSSFSFGSSNRFTPAAGVSSDGGGGGDGSKPTTGAPPPPPHREREGSAAGGVTGFLPALGERINLPRRLSERRHARRAQELRRMISAPREVRDGVGEVIRRGGEGWRERDAVPHRREQDWRDRDALYVREQQVQLQLQRERDRRAGGVGA